MTKTYVIIGTSAAGIGAAYRLRMLDASARIICISQEKEIPYNKCFIVEYLSGERNEQQLLTLTPESAQQKNIECMLGVKVTEIVPQEKKVVLSTTSSLQFDSLLIATGCSPIIPAIEGIEAHGVFTFHTMHDVHHIKTFIKEHNSRVAVVIGAGLSGLEAADGLIAHTINVHVIERASFVLSHHITPEAAAVIHNHMHVHGITLYCNTALKRVVQENGFVTGVELDNGIILKTDIVICTVGVRPNSNLALSAGIHTHNGSLLVDTFMQTNVPDIFAAGDVVLVKDQISGQLIPSCTWSDAMQQGMVAAYNMIGENRAYGGIVPTASSAFFGIKYMTCGVVKNIPSTYRTEIKKGEGWYHLFVYDEQDHLKGFILVGNTQESTQLKRTLLTSL